MGGVLGEQDDLTKSAYYSQCMWRGGAIPRQFSFTVGNLTVSFREKRTQKTLGPYTQVRKGSDNRGMFYFNPPSFSGHSCGPDMLSVS